MTTVHEPRAGNGPPRPTALEEALAFIRGAERNFTELSVGLLDECAVLPSITLLIRGRQWLELAAATPEPVGRVAAPATTAPRDRLRCLVAELAVLVATPDGPLWLQAIDRRLVDALGLLDEIEAAA